MALVARLVVAHNKDSHCAAVMHRSGTEFERDGAKLKGTRRCCLLHLHGAASASDDAVEADAQAVLQGAMWAGRGWLAGDASAVGVARVA